MWAGVKKSVAWGTDECERNARGVGGGGMGAQDPAPSAQLGRTERRAGSCCCCCCCCAGGGGSDGGDGGLCRGGDGRTMGVMPARGGSLALYAMAGDVVAEAGRDAGRDAGRVAGREAGREAGKDTGSARGEDAELVGRKKDVELEEERL